MNNTNLNILEFLTANPQVNGSLKQVDGQVKAQLAKMMPFGQIEYKDTKDMSHDLIFGKTLIHELEKGMGNSGKKVAPDNQDKTEFPNMLSERLHEYGALDNNVQKPEEMTGSVKTSQVVLNPDSMDKQGVQLDAQIRKSLSYSEQGELIVHTQSQGQSAQIESQSITQLIDQEENIVKFNSELRGQMPFSDSINNDNIKELLQNRSFELQNGKFKVLDSKVVDNRLRLELEIPQPQTDLANVKSSDTIKLTLPVDMLSVEKNDGSHINRVSLNTPIQDTLKLESLLEKAQVKQIEITGINNESSAKDLQPVEISLIGKNQGAETVIKSTMKRNQIKVIADPVTSFDAKNVQHKAAVLDDSGVFKNEFIETSETPKNKSEATILNTKVDGLNNTVTPNKLLGTRNTITDQMVNQRTDSFINFNTPIDHVESDDISETPKNIRMQLPDNIKSVLRPNGPSIMIKIDPENLGPAKLNLTFHDNKLRARLTVTSTAAKHLLESTVERLVDQLQKVNINVEKIDITMEDNETKQEQFHRQANWNRKMTLKNLHNEEFKQNGIEQLGIPLQQMTKQYVNASGVDLLA